MLSLRLLVRDWRAGELRLLTAAASLAIAIVIGISAFTGQLKMALIGQSHQFIAADRVISSPQAIARDWLARAERQHLRHARQLLFNSMLVHRQQFQLASIKAVSEAYPLRGQLMIQHRRESPPTSIRHGPGRGEIWLEESLLETLQVTIGETVELGEARLRVTALLHKEPDRASGFFNFAPHAMISADDVAATGVIQPGSRITYRYLFAGADEDLQAFRRWLKGRLADNQSWINIRTAQPAIASALDRGERFLLLAGTLGIALAGLAIAISARRYSERHYNHVALMKCFGARSRQILQLYLRQLLWLALLAMIIGSALGWAVQGLLTTALNQYIDSHQGLPGWPAIAMGALTAITCLLAFALPPFLSLSGIAPLQVLRRELGNRRMPLIGGLLSGLVSMTLLMWFYSRHLSLTLSLVIAAVAVLASVGGIVWLLLRLRPGQRHLASGRWRLALASLYRHAPRNALQTAIFSLAITLLLTLFLVRTSLLDEWQKQLPDDTPNHFLINILPAEVQAIRQWMNERGLAHSDLYPIIRGRLTLINGISIGQHLQDERLTHNDLNRELNLTWRQRLPDDNTLLAGQWWPDEAGNDRHRSNTAVPLSLEAGLARRMGIVIGDRLTFLIAGRRLQGRVDNLRQVDWDNMRPNFYVIFPPGVLDDFGQTYMTSFYLPATQKISLRQLVERFPSISVIAMDAIIDQIRAIIDQVSGAIEVVLWLIITAGLLVLLAAIQASLDTRLREHSLLRALGASRQLLLGSLIIEFASIGLLAGIIAAAAAELAAGSFQSQVMSMAFRFHPEIWLLGPTLGSLLVGGIGYLGCRRVVQVSPMRLLQAD